MLLIGLGQKLIPEKGIGKMVMVTVMARKASKITGIRNLRAQGLGIRNLGTHNLAIQDLGFQYQRN